MTGRFPAAAIGPFGLGTGPIGGLYTPVSPDDAAATLAAAWAAGIRFFDTAPHYGAGVAERRLGEFLRGVPRSQVVVSTKVGRLLVPGDSTPDGEEFDVDTGLVRVRDYSRDGVLRSISDSLDRTGLDRFDVVFIHDPDEYWEPAVSQAFPTLARLRAEGVVGAIGVGMNQSAMLARFVRETDLDVIIVAGRYTLLDREAETDLLPLCQAGGVSVLVGGVFNSGVLANPAPGAHYDYRPASEAVVRRAQRLREICAAHGVPLAAAALRFPTRHPAVTGILVGARSPAEVAEDLALASTVVPEPLWTELAAAGP
jgi:aryl-alcohol dehydrogenase-like predicted oxidoreductase